MKGIKHVLNSKRKERSAHYGLGKLRGHFGLVEVIYGELTHKGEWERYDCDKDKGIICDVGIDCGSVSGGNVLVGGHDCQGLG